MEHFAIVLSIVRAARRSNRKALERHIARLEEHLEKRGKIDEAAMLRHAGEPRRSGRKTASDGSLANDDVQQAECTTAS